MATDLTTLAAQIACECSDVNDPLYEDWVTDPDPARKRYDVADGDEARANALGEAQFLLDELAAIITRLTEDTDG